MRIRIQVGMFLCLFLLMVSGNKGLAAPAAAPSTMRLTQGWVKLPEVRTWVSVRDSAGKIVHGLKPGEFKLYLAGKPVVITKVAAPNANRAGLATVLMIDVSGSVAGTPFRQLKKAAVTFVDKMKAKDRIALMSFGSKVEVHQDFTADKAKLKAALDKLKPNHSKTKLFLGLRRAMGMLKRSGASFPKRKSILMMSDGKDEGSNLKLANILRDGKHADVPIYTVGYSRSASTRRKYFPLLDRLSKISNGKFYKAENARAIFPTMTKLMAHQASVYMVLGTFPHKLTTTGWFPSRVTVTRGGQSVYSEKQILIPSLPPPPAPAPVTEPANLTVQPRPSMNRTNLILLIVGLVLLLALVGGLLSHRHRKASYLQDDEDEFDEEGGYSLLDPEVGEALPGTVVNSSPPASRPSPSPAPKPSPTRGANPAPPSPPKADRVGRLRVEIFPGKTKLVANSPSFDIPKAGLVIGRVGDISIAQDEEISGKHASVKLVHGKLFVEDLNSTNGTLLNGNSMRYQEKVDSQDILQMGETKLRLILEEVKG